MGTRSITAIPKFNIIQNFTSGEAPFKGFTPPALRHLLSRFSRFCTRWVLSRRHIRVIAFTFRIGHEFLAVGRQLGALIPFVLSHCISLKN